MRSYYIDLMEKALSAYSKEQITEYTEKVRAEGLKEHGFPRLTANIGILIAHGRRRDLLPSFIEMMDLCCAEIGRPYMKAANEFSVRELVLCIVALDENHALDEKIILRWKRSVTELVARQCYNVIVDSEEDRITNWAIFGAVSEYTRVHFGLGGSPDFVERQLSCQMKWLDEHGMYCDYAEDSIHQPTVYDLVSRGLFCLLLHFGYRGKYYETIDKALERAAACTLKMQSSNGEVPFGGRSNQFLHNEPWMAAIFEYECARCLKKGDPELAKKYKSAANLCTSFTESWLDKLPITHIKNRYPTNSGYGCEGYAYFDKYMITVASNLYAAYLMCDDSIDADGKADTAPSAFVTSDHFHKVFLRCGEYALELDTNADLRYDCCGIGRIHRSGAPSAICMSHPCPSKPKYSLDISNVSPLSICPVVRVGEALSFGCDETVSYSVSRTACTETSAYGEITCLFPSDKKVDLLCLVHNEGVELEYKGDGEIGCMLPALCFDGERDTEIVCSQDTLSIIYDGWMCTYSTDGIIAELDISCANRNGHYRAFCAEGKDRLKVKVTIEKQTG